MDRDRIGGIVLAGGLARRMGGGDKGLLELHPGVTMLGEVVRCVTPQVAALALNANGDPARFASLGLPVVADTVEGFVGPLAGVLAGMRWAAQCDRQLAYVLSVSSDAPFLPDDLVQRLAEALAAGEGRIALARSQGGLHPVIGLWPVDLADDLEAALRSGVRKVLAWTDRHGAVEVEFASRSLGGRQVDPFFNANTPEELDEARRILAENGA